MPSFGADASLSAPPMRRASDIAMARPRPVPCSAALRSKRRKALPALAASCGLKAGTVVQKLTVSTARFLDGERHTHAAAFRRVGERVGEQAGQDAPHGLRIGAHERRLRGRRCRARCAARMRGRHARRRMAFASSVEIEIAQGERIAARLQIGEFEDVADLAMQSASAIPMSRAYSTVFRIADRAEHAALDDLGEADDGVQRRAQFVAHMRR